MGYPSERHPGSVSSWLPCLDYQGLESFPWSSFPQDMTMKFPFQGEGAGRLTQDPQMHTEGYVPSFEGAWGPPDK